MRRRSAAIIFKDKKILLFHRYREGRWYYSFPGGGIEIGESEEEAMRREVMEELSLTVKESILLFQVKTKLDGNYFFDIDKNFPRMEKYSPLQYFFLVTKYCGTPALGGPEKERQKENNQYIIEWIPIKEVEKIDDLFPREAREKLIDLLSQGNFPL
jgi:8-oxo-dGTP pyrophosphatase MutT (NUDIX family)